MWRREGGRIIIDLTQEQFDSLMLKLGFAAGEAARRGEDLTSHFMLVNAVNEGNPNFRPYVVNAPPAVHALRHGLALCGFSPQAPVHWPSGHLWASIEEPEAITCDNCAEEALKVRTTH